VLKERLREARRHLGYTQDDLAKKVNTQKTTISNYETGYSTPSNEMLIDLAKALKVSTDYLLGLSNSQNTNLNQESNIGDEDSELDELMKDPDFMVAYKEYPGSPEEAKEDLIGFLKLIKERDERKKNR
jgi:transcriptional regulator with XRE-family HTH domain